MKYHLVQKANPQDRTKKKWYANAIIAAKVGQKDIAKTIASKSSLTAGDIANVIQNLLEELPKELAKGNSVKLGEFGTFRISISSEGVENEKDFNTSMIKDVRIIFTPGQEIKKAIEDVSFERA
ncbi:HU family DNA-binding protein [Capnocytophaga sp.]|uniref:HU family DNA-binding protein n=1 Tax=Capnocytophaga sp. TaxID=44737 RepID=UPI0026DB8872|nr:HU family DNA-binding protein [Capnocytophaga sp.]MDO5104572.1 HU family DNA-binding protein [Capnocytophaga sp.]